MLQKVALITGGATGIGRASALYLADAGYSIAIVYNSSADAAEKVKSEISEKGNHCEIFCADVSDEIQCANLFKEVDSSFNRLDVLVDCAGATSFVKFSDLDAVNTQDWEKILRVNILGNFFCVREASKLMKKNCSGSVVIISSLAGVRPSGSSIPYATSKAGLNHMAKCLSMALAPDIRVNTISPGVVTDTAWHRNQPDFDRSTHNAKQSALIPLGRVANPDDVAEAVLFLASEKSANITGIDIVIDGGRSQVHHGQVY